MLLLIRTISFNIKHTVIIKTTEQQKYIFFLSFLIKTIYDNIHTINKGKNMKKYSDEEILEEFKNFSQDKHSLILSTSNSNNSPLTSYSPFVENDNNYYICISSMLPHYTNMAETKKAHVMIIEDEAVASHIYARKRLYFDVTCENVANEEEIFKLFDSRYGESLSFLRAMKDFKIFKLIPKEKSLILGFGAAYKLDKNGQLAQKAINHK